MTKYLAFIILVFVACSAPTEQEEKAPQQTRIVCTTGMIGDAVMGMVDSTSIVSVLMGPGTDPHLFKPTKASLDLLSEADIIVANGLHLEGRMQDVLEKLGRTKPVIFIGEAVEASALIFADQANDIPDPHLWFDVAIWKECVAGLANDLKENAVSIPHAPQYIENLEKLNEWARVQMSGIPSEQRILLTAHDAFSYFGRAYDTEVIGLQGISTVAEYGIRDVTNMVDTIVNRKIKAVFVESSISTRSIEAVIAGAREKGFDVALGGTLYSDALGPEDSEANTYEKMVRHNILTISRALK